MRLAFMGKTHAQHFAGLRVTRGDGFARIESLIHFGEEQKRLVAVAKLRTLAEAAFIPLHQRAMQQPGDGFVIRSTERAE
jgi:hypothetical protein